MSKKKFIYQNGQIIMDKLCHLDRHNFKLVKIKVTDNFN